MKPHGQCDAPGNPVVVCRDGLSLDHLNTSSRGVSEGRRGLGHAAPEPLYVLGSSPSTNTVVVGPHESLARTAVEARGRLYADAERVEAKLRYRSPALPAYVVPTERGFRLELDEPAYGVAPGQTAVLYDGDVVVGCGTVTSAQAH